MKNKTRYAIGIWRRDDVMDSYPDRLVKYIYENQDKFDIRRCDKTDKGDRAWIVLNYKEIPKAKEYFELIKDQEVLDFIDNTQDYDKWKVACECCNTINLNAIPYTYRGSICIGKQYNCMMCAGLSDRYAYMVRNELNKTQDVEKAMELLESMFDGTFVDTESDFYCDCCGLDLREISVVKDGERIIKSILSESTIISQPIDAYNKDQEENYKNGLYPRIYPVENIKEKDGYRCLECNSIISDKKLRKLKIIKGEC